METLPFSINALGKVRKTKWRGRDYFVAPLSLIVPGVLNGSGGATYYSEEELSKNPASWNGTPIVVYHPTALDANGQTINVSAKSPEVLDKSEIGSVFNTVFQDKLVAEGWFDVERTKEVDIRVFTALNRSEPMEVSTGLFMDREELEEELSFNNKSYKFIGKNFKPDHLAILPDQKGACSLQDGCGMLINKMELPALTQNEMSHEEIREQLSCLLKATFSQSDPYCYVMYVFDDYVIYEQGYKYYRQSYSKTDSSITLGTTPPTEVVREVQFISVANRQTLEREEPMKLNDSQRKELVAHLTANCDCWKNQETLVNTFTDEVLLSLKKKMEKEKNLEAVANAAKEGFGTINPEELKEKAKQFITNTEKKEEKKVETPVGNTTTLTAEQMEDLEWARNEKNRIRQEMIGKLTGNIADEGKRVESAKIYAGMTTNQLKVLVEAMPVQQAPNPYFQNYSGAGFPGTPAVNRQAAFDPNDVMPVAEMDWTTK